jgi:large subunit ribosomal protein L7e
LYSAIILRYDVETFEMLNLIDAYVTWGFINKKHISELLHKRGSYRDENGVAVQLQNDIIENNLGKFNILVLEDIIHEINKCGEHFNDVMKFLGFFLLSPTDEVKEKINVPFFRGGSQGFRGDKINELLKKMI